MKVKIGEGRKDLFVGTALSSRLPLSLHSHAREEKRDFATPLHLHVHLFLPRLRRATTSSKWVSRPSYTCRVLLAPGYVGSNSGSRQTEGKRRASVTEQFQ